MFTISKCFFIMITNTCIETYTTIIIGSVIPEVFCQIVTMFNKIFMNIFMLGTKLRQHTSFTVKFRIITKTIYSVIMKKLC